MKDELGAEAAHRGDLDGVRRLGDADRRARADGTRARPVRICRGPQWLVEGARPSHDQRRARADDYQPEADGFVEEVLAELFKELGLPDVWALLDQL